MSARFGKFKEKGFDDFAGRIQHDDAYRKFTGENLKEFRETQKELLRGGSPEEQPSKFRHSKIEHNDPEEQRLDQAVNFILSNHKSMTETQRKRLHNALV